ncbi:hypothetical protein YC2023_073669 [Brassica napus]
MNLTRTNVADALLSANLSDMCNLIVSNSNGILWQSFDHPTNVLLPGMILGYDLGIEYMILKFLFWPHRRMCQNLRIGCTPFHDYIQVSFLESIGPDTTKMLKPNTNEDVKPSSSSPSFSVTEQNAQRSCKASAMSTTRPAHYPATSNRFDCLIHFSMTLPLLG